MDATLVEKITRLVLSKLEEYSEDTSKQSAKSSSWNDNFSFTNRPDYPPLTEGELRKWEEISSLLSVPQETAASIETQPVYRPLTDEEIRRWQRITAEIERMNNRQKPSTDRVRGNGQIKFYRHY